MTVLMVEQNVRMALLLAEYGRTHWRSVRQLAEIHHQQNRLRTMPTQPPECWE